MADIGLILEGGGMRGAFTAGVLDCWLDRGLDFNDVYAVSAGACQACSYLCRQRGRGIRVWVNYIRDPRFCSMRSLITTGDLFGADFSYNVIPREYDPLDNETFLRRDVRFEVVVTNTRSGAAEYMRVDDMLKDIEVVRASSSLPLISRMVDIGGEKYLDGGISDSIPIEKSITDGHMRNVVVLTQAEDYQKEPNKAMALMRLRYARHPKLVETIANRHITYNRTLDLIRREAEAGRAFVIRPDVRPEIGRIERDPEKLRQLHDAGYAVAEREYNALLRFIEGENR